MISVSTFNPYPLSPSLLPYPYPYLHTLRENNTMENFDQVERRVDSSDKHNFDQDGTYSFHAEADIDIRYSAVKNNPCVGLTFFKMIALFWRKRNSIDWLLYPHRIICLLLMSVFNSFLSLLELLYISIILQANGVSKLATNDMEAPVFILGVPRSGTTLLHSLLSLDTERFFVCSTFCAGFPSCFLFFEKLGKRLFSGVLSETRPMDNMELHFDLPQEDELATCLLTGFQCSPYLSLYFPRDEKEFREYQTFRNSGKREINTWTSAFKVLIKKLKMREVISMIEKGLNPNIFHRRLLLKSPCHTGRARLLTKLFPNAKFVFIHRHPMEVFLSGAHMASTTYGYCFLQRPSDKELQEYILRQGEILIGEYLSCVDDGILGDHNSCEISFDQLTSNPETTIKKIYSSLNFDSFEEHSNSTYPIQLGNECMRLKGYQRNSFGKIKLSKQLVTEIKDRWSVQFSRFDYDK